MVAAADVQKVEAETSPTQPSAITATMPIRPARLNRGPFKRFLPGSSDFVRFDHDGARPVAPR